MWYAYYTTVLLYSARSFIHALRSWDFSDVRIYTWTNQVNSLTSHRVILLGLLSLFRLFPPGAAFGSLVVLVCLIFAERMTALNCCHREYVSEDNTFIYGTGTRK
jgi:hypothetical protein